MLLTQTEVWVPSSSQLPKQKHFGVDYSNSSEHLTPAFLLTLLIRKIKKKRTKKTQTRSSHRWWPQTDKL